MDAMLQQFQATLAKARHVCILTGAGVSAESGVPTFRGAGGLWRTYQATSLATPQAFTANPSLVWEFYHWRRELVSKCKPNSAHLAIAAFQNKAETDGRTVTLLTQNIDGLHMAAGSTSVTELHGSLWNICRVGRSGLKDPSKPAWEDHTQPLVPALAGKGAPEPGVTHADIPVSELPHDAEGFLLRPAVVWFGENLEARTLREAEDALDDCDLFITVGTSSAVYPAAGFASQVKQAGVPCAEFNLDVSGATAVCDYVFQGKAGELLPFALGVEEEVQQMLASQ